MKKVLSYLKRKVIPGTQRPEKMFSQDIKLDYKGLLLPGNKQPMALVLSFVIAEVCSCQRAMAREQPPVWQALWTLPLSSTQDGRRW